MTTLAPYAKTSTEEDPTKTSRQKGTTILDELIATNVHSETVNERRFSGVVLGEICALTDRHVWVNFPANPTNDILQAKSNVNLQKANIGDECTLLFEGDQANQPIIIGLIQKDFSKARAEEPIVIESDIGIILQSGHSSITLQANGEIAIEGKCITSRAYGANRVQGASVKIN